MARPKTEAEPLVTKSVQISQSDIDKIQRIAAEDGNSWAAVARRALRRGLKQIEKESR